MAKQLAIVIPAYKQTFLADALESIAQQTCHDFTLYIGDDCSLYPLENIVNEYRERIDLVYKRFDTNLGGKDLVSQWKRCIELSRGEPYIWLFSDDDVMDSHCVEIFLNTIEKDDGRHDLFHFDVDIIDEKGNVIRQGNEYPRILESFTFYKGKMMGGITSLVVENIFSRNVYERMGGFVNFDMAWGSDTATWCVFCREHGMLKMNGAKVLWRSSSENISPQKSAVVSERKMNALCDYYQWAINFFTDHRFACIYIDSLSFLMRMFSYSVNMSDAAKRKCIARFCKIHHVSLLKPLFHLLISIKAKR